MTSANPSWGPLVNVAANAKGEREIMEVRNINISMPEPAISPLPKMDSFLPEEADEDEKNSPPNGEVEHSSTNEQPPFKEFQQVLGFISSIGLAASVSGAFALVGVTDIFGDTSPQAQAKVRNSAILLGWASACFIVALIVVATSQLLYTELVIVSILMNKKVNKERTVVRVGVALFAWTALGFQTTALVLIGRGLAVFGPGPAALASYGMLGGAVLVGGVTMVGLISEHEGRHKLLRTVGRKRRSPMQG